MARENHNRHKQHGENKVIGKLSTQELKSISRTLYQAIDDAFSNMALSEPQLIANLVKEIPEKVNAMRPVAGNKVYSTGVFVHSKPFVQCDNFPEKRPQSVEIGDLLLVRTLVVNGVVGERRALLMQAKKTARIPTIPDNKNQWHLYERWPEFTYAARSGKLTGKKRHIVEPDMYDGAKYLLLNTGSTPTTHFWPYYFQSNLAHSTAQPTQPAIGRYRALLLELVDFITGNGGKIFNSPQAGVNGWDQVINDLISETANAMSVYPARAARRPGRSARGMGAVWAPANGYKHSIFAQLLEFDFFGPSPPPDTPDRGPEDSDNQESGIPIIEFIVQEEVEWR